MKQIAMLAGALAAVSVSAAPARAQTARLGVAVPESSLQLPADLGRRAHTNVRRLVVPRALTPDGAPAAGVYYETPASLACIYGLTKPVKGCNPQTLTRNASGGSGLVAIVDAYDNPTVLADLVVYDQQFGLPTSNAGNFSVVYASGTQPAYDSGWATEEAIDVEMVHALAPKAKIVLVEAASNSFTNLLAAEQVAVGLVMAAGGGEVSNSWSGAEFSAETSAAYTSPFTGSGVVFFASTGDYEIPGYPAVLSSVVAAGGTSVSRDPATGAYAHEVSWSNAGAGPSQYVAKPAYQAGISVLKTRRGTPDIAAVGNPDTGVWIYTGGSWSIWGGTSVASPVLAAITNAAGHFAASTTAELTAIYANSGSAAFHDITLGTCGDYQFYAAATGWDFCTGVGSPANLLGE